MTDDERYVRFACHGMTVASQFIEIGERRGQTLRRKGVPIDPDESVVAEMAFDLAYAMEIEYLKRRDRKEPTE